MEEAMARRFELWQQGDYRELVASWSHDRMAAALKEDRDMDRASAIRQAIALIEDGCLSKAMAHLGEHGLGDLGLPAIQAQLLMKHPQERQEWARERLEGRPRLVPGDARKALMNMRRNSGVGADRFRAEYLVRLVRGEMDAGVRGSVLGAWQVFSERVVNDDFPPWFYLVWTTVVQFAPIKAAGVTPAEHEVRPVGCGGICRRAIMVQVKMAQKVTLQAKCEPIQLGQGTSGGTQAFGIGLKMHMQLFPRHVLVPVDISTPRRGVDHWVTLRGAELSERVRSRGACFADRKTLYWIPSEMSVCPSVRLSVRSHLVPCLFCRSKQKWAK